METHIVKAGAFRSAVNLNIMNKWMYRESNLKLKAFSFSSQKQSDSHSACPQFL